MLGDGKMTYPGISSRCYPLLLCLLLLLFFASCSDKKVQAQKTQNFLDQVAKGNPEAVISILNSGIDVNARDTDGDTALIIAAASGRTGMVKLLLEKGADFNARNNRGLTALMVASAMGKTDMVELLHNAGAKE